MAPTGGLRAKNTDSTILDAAESHLVHLFVIFLQSSNMSPPRECGSDGWEEVGPVQVDETLRAEQKTSSARESEEAALLQNPPAVKT